MSHFRSSVIMSVARYRDRARLFSEFLVRLHRRLPASPKPQAEAGRERSADMRVQQAVLLIVVALAAGCSGPEQPSPSSANPTTTPAAPTTAPIPPPVAGRVFVTNENGGDISVI